jgi:glutamate synthase domain-containing protein 2
VGAPLQEGLLLVHNTLKGIGLREQIRVGASGKIISAFDISRSMALGADWCNSARGFMFALGCLQAQSCHTGHCPTGVSTQDPDRMRALVVPDKAERVFNFHQNTLHALQELVQAAGLKHPSEITAHHIVRRVNENEVRLLANLVPQVATGSLLDRDISALHNVYKLYWPKASADHFAMVAS